MTEQQNSTGLHAWMAAKPGRRLLVAAVLFVVGMTAFFAAWFGLAVLFGDGEDGGALALNRVLVGFCAVLPLLVLIAVCMLSLYRQVRRRDAGLLDEAGKRLLNAEMNWLLAFAGALAATMLVCRVAGSVVGA